MPSIILKQYSLPESNSGGEIINSPNPLSFSDWISINYGIAGDDAEAQYQKYIIDWYSSKEEAQTNVSIKEDYKDLLKKLSIVFRNDGDFSRIASLDLEDDLQLKLAVPYYVKKLKEIALYYRDKRESVKRAKLKYNMVGSFNAIERTFYEYILKAFSKRDYVLNVPSQSAWNLFPDLSSANTGFSIEVEELFDDSDYFDPLDDNTYSYDISSTNPLLFLLEKYISDEYDTKIISEIPLSALQIPLEQNDTFGSYVLNLESINDANEIYTSSNKFLLGGGYYINDETPITLNFKSGNNFFYWFSGEHLAEAPHKNYAAININDLDWVGSGATAATDYSSSDVIFANYNGTIRGAWLSEVDNVIVSAMMGANLRNNKEFRFPYPGIGVSAEGLEWTGKQVNEFDQYEKSFFPNQTIKNKVQAELTKKYWAEIDSISSVNPIYLNNTTLIDAGAFASKKFQLADKVITRPFTSDGVHDEIPDEIFSEDLSVEWLYDFDKTQIPILTGDNKIYWPLQRYEQISDLNLNYKHGEELQLADIPMEKFFGAVAATTLEEADMIFKYDSKCGSSIEAAWLYGTPLTVFNACVDSGSATLVEVGGGNTTPIFTPYKVPSLKHWWVIEAVKTRKATQVNPKNKNRRRVDEFANWVDVVSNQVMSPDDRRSRPLIEQGNIVFNEQLLNVNFKNNNESSYNTNDGIKWDNAGNPVNTPFTIAIAFRHRLQNQAHNHTLMETDTRVDGRRMSIEIRGNRIRMESGSTKLISSASVVNGSWHYCIAVFNGENSKLIVDGVETLGNVKVNPLAKVLIGQSFSLKRQFIGDIRDVIIFNDAISIDHQDGLKGYMSGLTSLSIYRPQLSPTQIKSELITNNNELSGAVLSAGAAESVVGNFAGGAIQPGISFKADPRQFTRFIWTGNGSIIDSGNLNISKNIGFQGKEHDRACPYYNINKNKRISPLDTSRANDQWKSCDCLAIQYSPLGHTGTSYKDVADIGDFIILDTEFPKATTLDTWRGADGLPWHSSEDFGWFQLNEGQLDEKAGWGKGKWITNYGEDFSLKHGQIYLYYRSGFNVSCEAREEFGYDEPFFILNHVNCGCSYIDCGCEVQECGPVWKRAEFSNGNWIATDSPTTLKLESGKYYSYLHRDKKKFAINISEDEIYEDCTKTTNFILGVDITDAKPYWAKGTFEFGKNTKNKGLMYSGELSEIQFEYLPLTQPLPSTLLLTNDLFFKYERNSSCSTDCFVWEEPLVFEVKIDNVSWKELHIDQCIESEVLGIIKNIGCSNCNRLNKKCQSCCEAENLCGCVIDNCITTRVGVSASNDISTLSLVTQFETEPLFINYHSKGSFELPVTVIDTTNGIAPSGGIWVEESFSSFTESKYPWKNIPSIFFPMIANEESSQLYGILDCGFFVPSRLGYSNLILKDKIIGLDSTNSRTLSSYDIILDNNNYVSGPYVVTYTDSTWMKHRSNCLAGSIKNPIDYQTFSPYQSTYETLKRNTFGIQQQTDIISPWVGKYSDSLVDPEKYKADIVGNLNIYCGPNSWVESQPTIDGELTVWKSDVYGNQYGLYKSGPFETITSKLTANGKLWIRNSSGIVGDSTELFSRVIDTYSYIPELVSDLTGSGIVNFDIFYDTAIIQTDDYVVVEKLKLDYNTGEIYSIADNSYIFNINKYDFSGYWADESQKTLTFGYLSGGIPVIKKLELNTSNITTLLDGSGDTSMWDISVNGLGVPKFTFNSDNNTFNMTRLALSGSNQVLVVSNFEFSEAIDKVKTADVKIITESTLSGKNIIKTSAFDDSLLLVFETYADSVNKIYQILIDN